MMTTQPQQPRQPQPYFPAGVDRLIDLALEEDIGGGDITSRPLIDPLAQGEAVIVAKEALVVCGLPVAERVFRRFDDGCSFAAGIAEGGLAAAGETVATIRGRMAALLMAERTALNFMQRLSGIATQARRYVQAVQDVQAVKGSPATLVDTRKTTPGLRVLEKYAVRVGGAANHRMGLHDGVLIKDNHIAACGGITAAVTRIRRHVPHLVKIEVETTTIEEVREALAAGADVIMLDNMDLDMIRKAVAEVKGRALVEISGGVTLERLPELARTGADLISCGALTHSARAVDLSMRVKPVAG